MSTSFNSGHSSGHLRRAFLGLVCVGAMVVMAACHNPEWQVKPGMTERQVLELAGAPGKIIEREDVAIPGANRGIDRVKFEGDAEVKVWHYMGAEIVFNLRGTVVKVNRRKVSWP